MKKCLLILFGLIVLVACSKDGSSNTTPGAVKLVFPENNSLCVTGVPQSGDRSEVTFTWEAATNARR